MKKIAIFSVIIMLIISLCFVVSCDDSTSSNDNGYTGGNENDGDVSIITEAYLTKTIGGIQSASDKVYSGEYVYLYVNILEATNTSSSPQAVGITITIDNAKCMEVKNESYQDAEPQIKETDRGIDESQTVTSISGMNFTINANSTKKPTTYIFKIRPSKECDGEIKISYSNGILSSGATYTKSYTFYKREHLDKIEKPIISLNKDRAEWTESPMQNTDEKLYWVQVLDKDGNVVYTEVQNNNWLTLSELVSEEIVSGEYKLKVMTMGDNTITLDSETQTFSFTIVDTVTPVMNDRGMVSWETVPDVSYYELIINSNYKVTLQEAFYNLPKEYEGEKGNIKIQVIPIFDNSNKVCMISKELTATILDAPVVTVSGGKASWKAVEGASVYDIYINDEFIETISTTEYRKQIGENLILNVVARNGRDEVSAYSEAVDISTD